MTRDQAIWTVVVLTDVMKDPAAMARYGTFGDAKIRVIIQTLKDEHQIKTLD